MSELLRYIAQNLVDKPDEVQVSVRHEEKDALVYELRTAPEDVGKVIGKQGRTAKAIRAILSASRVEDDQRARLEIVQYMPAHRQAEKETDQAEAE